MQRFFMTAVAGHRWIGRIIFVALKDLMLTCREYRRFHFAISMRICPVILQKHNELDQTAPANSLNALGVTQEAVFVPRLGGE